MSFHIMFPAFSIGHRLSCGAGRFGCGRARGLHPLFNCWLKIFAVAFGMGVVSGIVMYYQFGTNWGSADKAGW
jgi:cytochrome d ubiquinol oxidase subunit I